MRTTGITIQKREVSPLVRRHTSSLIKNLFRTSHHSLNLVPTTGIERVTYWLQVSCSNYWAKSAWWLSSEDSGHDECGKELTHSSESQKSRSGERQNWFRPSFLVTTEKRSPIMFHNLSAYRLRLKSRRLTAENTSSSRTRRQNPYSHMKLQLLQP